MIDDAHNRTFKLYGDIEIPVYQYTPRQSAGRALSGQYRRGLYVLTAHRIA